MELNYHHLRYFQAVAIEGNLTRAAEILNVSQSAVSTQIRLLEDRLGQQLFERRGRALLLTEAGRIALDYANSIFASGDELVATLQASGHQRQALRVGSLATLSRNFQLQFLRPLLGRSDVEVILRSGSAGELFNALADLHLDVVLTNQPPPPDTLNSFIVRRLDEQGVSLIATPALLAGARPIAQLIAETPMILATPGSALRMGFDAMADRLGLRPQIAAEVDDMAMMRLLAREGVGLAAIPPIVVRDELASGELVECAELPGFVESFYGVTVERKFPNPLLQTLF
ncbi:LysR family transcriptional regulator [Altererythrobacter sp. BO-6]|uniref:LysR family transcriptional regulator n=1 Tax=Altererythrobacter sp. BO-6 TaxID=2604537 RepID=UPI0013E15586|nr:LysR family transcriptional regulator [Altererythrobacter sp. BO-6]QIG54941.1 LysR family transcriptional regulator [Altererythrobacter sp. BO-6]